MSHSSPLAGSTGPLAGSTGFSAPRIRLWLTCILVFIGIAALTRLALSIWIGLDTPGSMLSILSAWPAGLLDDLATALVLGLPFLAGLYLLARPLNWRIGRPLAHLLLLVLTGVAVFSAVAEIFFWNEFNSRFNGIAVYYLIFPKEVIGNIRESFDLRIYLPPIILVAALIYLLMRPRLRAALAMPPVRGEWKAALRAGALASLLALPAMALGPFEPAVERNVNELAVNGIHSLLRAALTNDSKYDGVYAGMPEAEALPLVKAMVRQDNTTPLVPADARSLLRRVDNSQGRDLAAAKKLNVVLILEESFGSVYFEDVFQDKQRDYARTVSPNWHRLAEQGLLFTNIYATGDRTVRALEAVFTSFAPIPGISTARRAGSEDMHSLPFQLKAQGYRSQFLYGGPTNFDNMGHFWQSIGFDSVLGQNDIKDRGFKTIWGVADEYLFKEALDRIDAMAGQPGPFLFSMLTVTNHRPFLYPEGRIAQKPSPNERDNSAAYADWALGQFIDAARSKPWFDDTLFVMIGDHGPKVWGAAQIPVQAFRVPLLFLAPKHLPAARNPVLGSSLDVTPTIMGLLGLSFDSPFFGVDLRHVPEGGGRIAMAHNFDVAVGDGKHAVVLTPKGDLRGYSMQVGAHQLEPAKDVPELIRKQAVAMTQTAHRMFYAHQYHEK
ncbi:LTA synthase family protein [Ferrovibrio sp.]|uniref:LTA synthase family protein n=1 Tax=Ferrovibrio sp. TaxID=1917215 RepID=UPI0035B4EBAF